MKTTKTIAGRKNVVRKSGKKVAIRVRPLKRNVSRI